MYELVRWVKALAADGEADFNDVAGELQDVHVFTVDDIERPQRAFVFFDTVVAGSLGFMGDTSRVLLGITRPSLGLIIIGNSGACRQAAENYSESALYRLTEYCKDNNHYINMDLHKKRFDAVSLPFDLGKQLASVHRPRANTDQSFDFSEASAWAWGLEADAGGVRLGDSVDWEAPLSNPSGDYNW
jgi:hypothetical protein